MHGLSNANEDCAVWANIKEIVACAHVISSVSDSQQVCAIEAGKAVEEI